MKEKILIVLGVLIYMGSIAQNLQGVVKSANGENLSFVNIIIEQQNLHTITNYKGEFQFHNLKSDIYKLKFSFIGKTSIEKEVEITEGKLVVFVNIVMFDTQFKTEEVVVTATKNVRLLNSIPACIEYISAKELVSLPSQKIDENLKFTSGIFVDRKFGIFGKSVVAMRGVVSSEPGRQLVLIDGVPINKSDGGGVNWNRIINSNIEHIEAVKGPSSSIYGSNAMGGTINLITKRPAKKGVSGSAKAYYGTYNTSSAEFNIMQKINNKVAGFYYSVSAKALKSDGYNTVPDSIRDETDTLVFVEEQAANACIGYKFSYKTFLELEYNYYNDHRGQGTKIKLNDGATVDYDTHFLKSKFKTEIGKFKVDINTFYQLEEYLRTIEKMKKDNYTLINVNSDRVDYGVLSSVNSRFGKNRISFGADYRNGSVYGIDVYQTSTDKVLNKGKINHINLYLQDEIKLSNKFLSIAAIHFAYVNFYDGVFLMKDETGINNFMKDDTGELQEKSWNNFSPSLSVQYNFSKKINVYAIASKGFRAASLDDLTRTGFINIGYKKANPLLAPETINNIEVGGRCTYKKLMLTANTYYMQGFDFMYYVATGESLFNGKKKVYKKQNISYVEIYGTELSIQYNLKSWLNFKANYTYNSSVIQKFEGRTNLEGKFLTYTPSNMFNFTTIIYNKKWSSSVNIHWQDKIFLDEENIFEIDALVGLDIRLAYNIYKGLGAGVNVQNVFDERHMVSSDQVSLGRFVIFELNYRF